MSGEKPPLVLVVEDDPGIAELVAERLVGAGYACACASTGAAAIAYLAGERPDLVVLDYSLPDMRADEVIRSPDMVPFMIATGRGDEETVVKFMRAGARDYLIKDSSFLDELPAVAGRVLRELETERRLAEARARLEASLLEKDAMLREIHHRVRNNLQIIQSLLRLQEPAGAGEELRSILSDVQGRISAMALIHETLYESEDLAKVDFLRYLDGLTRGVATALVPADRRVDLACEGVSFDLTIEKAVPLGLIANEILTNAVKHAFPPPWTGEARVHAVAGIGQAGPFIEIADNGIGMARPGERPSPGEGLGLKLIEILAQQIRADLSVEDGNPGTRWRVALR